MAGERGCSNPEFRIWRGAAWHPKWRCWSLDVHSLSTKWRDSQDWHTCPRPIWWRCKDIHRRLLAVLRSTNCSGRLQHSNVMCCQCMGDRPPSWQETKLLQTIDKLKIKAGWFPLQCNFSHRFSPNKEWCSFLSQGSFSKSGQQDQRQAWVSWSSGCEQVQCDTLRPPPTAYANHYFPHGAARKCFQEKGKREREREYHKSLDQLPNRQPSSLVISYLYGSLIICILTNLSICLSICQFLYV